MNGVYELVKENDELKRYIKFLEMKCNEYEKYYAMEIELINTLPSMPFISSNEAVEFDTEFIRIPERRIYARCEDLSSIRGKMKNLERVKQ